MEKTTKIKLNLACGQDYREGYINIDNMSMYNGRMKVDIEADVKIFEFEKDTVEEILLLHFMMYIHLTEALTLFKKWYSWLKKDGKLVIETGDLKKICKTILDSNNPDVINGTNGVMQLHGWDTTAGHTWGWCFDTIQLLLLQAGFRIITYKDGGTHNRPERDITIVATK